MLSDDDPKKINQSGLEMYMGHFPAGTSYKCLDHYRQLLLTDCFQKYDYGLEKNLSLYGSETPPLIDLQSFSGLPIAMLCGKTDKLSNQYDYAWLRDILAMNSNCIYFKEYDLGHVAFLMPNDNDRRYYIEMLELCKTFNRQYDGPARSQIPKEILMTSLARAVIKDNKSLEVLEQEIISRIEEDVIKNIEHMSRYKPQ